MRGRPVGKARGLVDTCAVHAARPTRRATWTSAAALSVAAGSRPDTEAAATTLKNAGFRVERTPEDWLFKACVGNDFVIDVLHRLNDVPVDAETISAAETYDVLAIAMPVLSPTHVVTEKLNSLNEHHCDFATLLPGVRAVRERVDWDHVRANTADNDFAAAFLVLTDRLGITA
jgi:hypothetical protein